MSRHPPAKLTRYVVTTQPPKRGRGGHRPGSGAPKKEIHKVAFSIRIDPQLMAKIEEVLETNLSLTRTDLVTKALELYLEQRP